MELKKWLDDVKDHGMPSVTLKDIEEKFKQINDTLVKKYTAEQIRSHVDKNVLSSAGNKGSKSLHPQEKLKILEQKLNQLEFQHFEKPSQYFKREIHDTKINIQKMKRELRQTNNIDLHDWTNAPLKHTTLITFTHQENKEVSFFVC